MQAGLRPACREVLTASRARSTCAAIHTLPCTHCHTHTHATTHDPRLRHAKQGLASHSATTAHRRAPPCTTLPCSCATPRSPQHLLHIIASLRPPRVQDHARAQISPKPTALAARHCIIASLHHCTIAPSVCAGPHACPRFPGTSS